MAKAMVLITYFVLQVVLSILYIPDITAFFKGDMRNPLSILVCVIKAFQLAIDIAMLAVFTYLFYFFTKHKYNLIKSDEKHFTFANWALVIWVGILVMMEIVNIFLRDVLSPLYLISNVEKDRVLKFVEINRFLWYQISDFLKGTTMLHLIFLQGKFAIHMREI